MKKNLTATTRKGIKSHNLLIRSNYFHGSGSSLCHQITNQIIKSKGNTHWHIKLRENTVLNSSPKPNSILSLQSTITVSLRCSKLNEVHKAENTNPSNLKWKYFYLWSSLDRMQKVKFSYVIANAMNLVNPYLPWQEKKKKRRRKYCSSS